MPFARRARDDVDRIVGGAFVERDVVGGEGALHPVRERERESSGDGLDN